MHRKNIHVIYIVFFLPYLQDHGLLRSRHFATMATSRNDFSLGGCGNIGMEI